MTEDPLAQTRNELELLFREHAAGLAGAARGILGRPEDVSEVLQEAFLKAWRAISSGASPRDTVAWIFVLTLNTARDRRRTRERRPPAMDLDEVNPLKLARETNRYDQRPDHIIERTETMDAARRAIHLLCQEEREVFLLRTSAGLTFEAVAGALSIPVGTAKTRMRAALARLRERLAEFDPMPARMVRMRPGLEGKEKESGDAVERETI